MKTCTLWSKSGAFQPDVIICILSLSCKPEVIVFYDNESYENMTFEWRYALL